MQPPHVILVSGLSCSGKSTLADSVARALDGEMVRVDDYYFETDPSDFDSTDFDDPAMIDIGLLTMHLRQLKMGMPVQSQHYDFSECRYTRFRAVLPKSFLIVEGQYAATYVPLLDLACLSIYLDVSPELCLSRRLTRDQKTLHRSLADSQHRFQSKVVPAFEKHRLALRTNSNLILGAGSQSQWLLQVKDALSALGLKV